MEFLKKQTSIDFIGHRRYAVVFSAILLGISLVSFGVRGLNFGIDFTGGMLIEIGYPQTADLTIARAVLDEVGYPSAVVQHFGTARDVLVRLAPRGEGSQAEESTRVYRRLEEASGEKLDLRRVEFVGPQIGDELTEQGGLAMLIALGGILIYVALRFEKRFAAGAVAALIHDVVITIGAFSVTGIEFDLTVLAALLAVIGYSLNDTIVVFDRIRENFRKMRKGSPHEIVNASVNQTLTRTLMTSFTTLLVLAALFVFGGELIHAFSIALIVGVVIGTYSSIYVASTLAVALGVSKADLMHEPLPEEGGKADVQP